MKNKGFAPLLIIALVALVGVSAFFALSKKFPTVDKLTKVLETPTSTSTPNPTATPAPQYTVEVLSSTTAKQEAPQDVTIKVKLSNFGVTPFITNFAFSECKFVDGDGKGHEGRFMMEKSFEKAISPGTLQTFSLTGQAEVNGYEHHVSGLRRCDYQASGEKVCSVLKDVRVKSCSAYITSDGSQASNGWGKSSVIADFP